MKKLYTLMFALLIPIEGLCAEDPNKEKPIKPFSEQELKELARKNQEQQLSDLVDMARTLDRVSQIKRSFPSVSPSSSRSVTRGAELETYNNQRVGDLPTFRYGDSLSASENLRNIKYRLFALKPGEKLVVKGLSADNPSSQQEFLDLVGKVPGIVLSLQLPAMGVAVVKKE